MIVIPIQIYGMGGRVLDLDAGIDTGFTSGILVSKTRARSIGLILVKPERLPKTISNEPLRGTSTVATVSIPDAGVEAETLVFCPDIDLEETLIGSLFLAQVGTSIKIGDLELKYPRPNRRLKLNPYDMGDVIVPLRYGKKLR